MNTWIIIWQFVGEQFDNEWQHGTIATDRRAAEQNARMFNRQTHGMKYMAIPLPTTL